MIIPNKFILKMDRQGRLCYSAQQQSTMVDGYLNSGLSAPRFAALHGVNYQTLVYWIKKSKVKPSSDSTKTSHPALLSLIAAEFDPSSPRLGTCRRLLDVDHAKLGAKNWLFLGTEQSGQKCATPCTLVENCRRLGIHPKEYLTDVLTRLSGMLFINSIILTEIFAINAGIVLQWGAFLHKSWYTETV